MQMISPNSSTTHKMLYSEYLYTTDSFGMGTTGVSLGMRTINDTWRTYRFPDATWQTSSNYLIVKRFSDANTTSERYEYLTTSYLAGSVGVPWEKPLKDRLREIIQSRHSPFIKNSRDTFFKTEVDDREVAARETLCRIVGSIRYRDYLRKGFLSVKSKSGLFYQLFPGHGITRVYKNGECIERLCVIMYNNYTPTDEMLMRYLLILNDEKEFRKIAVKHSAYKEEQKKVQERRSLTEIFRDLKAKVA